MAGETVLILEVPSTALVSAGTQGPQGPPSEEEMVYSKRVDFVGDTVIYKGEAVVGTTEVAAGWRVRRITFVGEDIKEEWAGGTAAFDKIWADRASLSYS